MSAFNQETVLSVRHWNQDLFSFKATRDPSFRFKNGQFTMMGLEVNGRPLLRAFSMVSANYDDDLEFFSIKVENGPLTSRLQHIKPGDRILVGKKPTGTLVIDNLRDGKRLYLLSTGTGLAPFMSVIRDPETYERYSRVILVHGCRQVSDLAYRDWLTSELHECEFLGEMFKEKLIYYPTVTRETFERSGRITELMTSGKLYEDVGMPQLNRDEDRVMVCGGPGMLSDIRTILMAQGWEEGNMGEPGDFVIEKAFVER